MILSTSIPWYRLFSLSVGSQMIKHDPEMDHHLKRVDSSVCVLEMEFKLTDLHVSFCHLIQSSVQLMINFALVPRKVHQVTYSRPQRQSVLATDFIFFVSFIVSQGISFILQASFIMRIIHVHQG